MSPEEINFLTPLLCIGSPVALGVFAFALHKSHEIRAGWDRPQPHVSNNPGPEIRGFIRYFHTGDPNLLHDVPQGRDPDLWIYWRGRIQEDQKAKKLLLDYSHKNPHGDLGTFVTTVYNQAYRPVSQAQHRELVERVTADERVLRQTHELAKNAHQRLDGHDVLIKSGQEKSKRQQQQIETLAESNNRVVSFLEFALRGRHKPAKNSGKLLSPPRS